MTTGTIDRPGILDRPDTIHQPITGAFEEAIAGYSMEFKCEWVHGCANEVAWFGDAHGCEQAHICDQHLAFIERRFVESLMTWGSHSCIYCKKKFTDFEKYAKFRPI